MYDPTSGGGYTDTFLADGTLLTSTAYRGITEVEFPYQQDWLYSPTAVTSVDQSQYALQVNMAPQTDVNPGCMLMVYACVADDFRFMYMLPPPDDPIVLTVTPITPAPAAEIRARPKGVVAVGDIEDWDASAFDEVVARRFNNQRK